MSFRDRRFLNTVLILATICLVGGCRRGGRAIKPPSLDASAAARKAMEEYDTNKDGVLDAKELEKCPALKAALKEFDKNNDGKISEEEIEERLKTYKEDGLVAIIGRLTLDRKPLEGATVTLVPEKFLGSAFKAASGISDERGNVSFKTEGYDLPGAPCGLFRIEVSKKDASGKELIPARYNTQTTLGCEIVSGQRLGDSLPIHLTSK
jgi:hypothetical protein